MYLGKLEGSLFISLNISAYIMSSELYAFIKDLSGIVVYLRITRRARSMLRRPTVSAG